MCIEPPEPPDIKSVHSLCKMKHRCFSFVAQEIQNATLRILPKSFSKYIYTVLIGGVFV